ncbi:MAG: thioredoxin [Verrucomicrobia bacterium]|nr:thioredoxin [Verrucomicrobiota bacterium]
MSANTIELNAASFPAAISSSTPVLVDFWAPWCGPCKAIAPVLEELGAELKGRVTIAKVNVDDNDQLAAQYNVRAIPTMLLFKGGTLVDTMVGMLPKPDIKQRLLAKV